MAFGQEIQLLTNYCILLVKSMKPSKDSKCLEVRAVFLCQGGDAEEIKEIDKEAKRWAVGVLATSKWTNTFRNLDYLNQLRSNTLSDAGISDRKNISHTTND